MSSSTTTLNPPRASRTPPPTTAAATAADTGHQCIGSFFNASVISSPATNVGAVARKGWKDEEEEDEFHLLHTNIQHGQDTAGETEAPANAPYTASEREITFPTYPVTCSSALRDPNVGLSKKIRKMKQPTTTGAVSISGNRETSPRTTSYSSQSNQEPACNGTGANGTLTTTVSTNRPSTTEARWYGLSRKIPRAQAAEAAASATSTLPVYRGLQQPAPKLRNNNNNNNSNTGENTLPPPRTATSALPVYRGLRQRAAKLRNNNNSNHDINETTNPNDSITSVAAITGDATRQENNAMASHDQVVDVPGPTMRSTELSVVSIKSSSTFERSGALEVRRSVSNSNLAVAREIYEEEANLVRAEEVDVESAQQKKSDRSKDRWRNVLLMMLALLCLCIVVSAILAVVLHTQNNESSSPTSLAVTTTTAPSESPSSAPTGALDLLRESLPEYTGASLEVFDSPQWKAWDWLKNHPELSDMEEGRKQRLFALATFYYSMDGDNWLKPVRDRWKQYSDECLWYSNEFGYFLNNWGVYEYHQWKRGWGGIPPCNQDGEFQNIALQTRESFLASSLQNPFIPPEIALLTSLSVLSLPFNSLNNSINAFLPPQLYQMTNMKMLWMQQNLFTGHIPRELGSLTNMESLNLERNSLTGPIPGQLGLITGMVNLELFSNRFTGEIPTELGLMTNLKKLVLDVNRLTGPIPSELAKMSDMWKLHLSGNHLTGTVPRELEALAMNGSLRSLSLHNNSLSGTIPGGLCSLGLVDKRPSPIMGDIFRSRFLLGLSFDCNERLCGCCWCPCPGSNYITTEECETDQDKKFREDKDWPGAFPTPSNNTNSITVNIRSDEIPIQTTFDWSVQDEESGLWNVTHSKGLPAEGKHMVHSYTIPIASDALYRLQLHDTWGDGTCCWYGLGWFTITSSIPSQDYANGTVVWEATGFYVQFLLVVYIWVDSNGIAHQVENFPGQGFALVQENGGTTP